MPNRIGLRRHRHLLVGCWLSLLTTATLSSSAQAQMSAPADGAKPVFLVADVVVGDGVPLEKDAARDVL